MDAADLKAYMDRWKAVENIEQQELKLLSINDRWQQLNSIYALAHKLGILANLDNRDEEFVWLRWSKIRELM